MQVMWVQFLGLEDPPKKEIATHSSFLAWEIPWTKEPGMSQSKGLQKSWTLLSNWTTTSVLFIGTWPDKCHPNPQNYLDNVPFL